MKDSPHNTPKQIETEPEFSVFDSYLQREHLFKSQSAYGALWILVSVLTAIHMTSSMIIIALSIFALIVGWLYMKEPMMKILKSMPTNTTLFKPVTNQSSTLMNALASGAKRSRILMTMIGIKLMQPPVSTKQKEIELLKSQIYNEFSELLDLNSLENTSKNGSPSSQE
jgi:hypothetical protein